MKIKLPKKKSSPYFSAHVHSNLSTGDGMNKVVDMVYRAHQYGQPALALTDHGNMSGTVQLYKETKALGMKCFPGSELYIIDPKFDKSNLDQADDKTQRYHLGILALNLKGYQGLVKLSTLSFTRPRFSRFPRLLVDDLLDFGEEYGNDIALTTGCVFGLVERPLWEDGLEAAEGALNALKSVTPNLYVELQKHGIPDDQTEMPEDELIANMLDLADRHSLPIIATPDCHYSDQRYQTAHTLMKKMLYNNNEEDGFPGDSYHLPSESWISEKFEPHVWSRVLDSCQGLLDKNTLVIPQLDTFTAHVPEISKTADQDLYTRCFASLMRYDVKPDDFPEYSARLEHELKVIKAIGVANYFLLVLLCVEYLNSKEVPIEARGSANGSLVCFLLGITQVDPILWGTSFERFLGSLDENGWDPSFEEV